MESLKKNWVPILIAFGALASGYLMYQCILLEDCPIMRKKKYIQGIVQWDLSQEEKEKQARKWMENYVRCELLTKKKNPKNILCKNKVAD